MGEALKKTDGNKQIRKITNGRGIIFPPKADRPLAEIGLSMRSKIIKISVK